VQSLERSISQPRCPHTRRVSKGTGTVVVFVPSHQRSDSEKSSVVAVVVAVAAVADHFQ
jgi:hypothetical protein